MRSVKSLLGELSRLEPISLGLDSGGEIASDVFVIDNGGPVTAKGPSGSRSRFRDDEGASAAVGEEPAIDIGDLLVSRDLDFTSCSIYLHFQRWTAKRDIDCS